jgi:outer membrane protein assembly factor BamB
MASGMVQWVFDVGAPLSFAGVRPIAEYVYENAPGGFKQYDEVFFCAGEKLFALDKTNGSELWTVKLPFTPSAPPHATETHVFVGSYEIRKDSPLVSNWSPRTEGDVENTSETKIDAADEQLKARMGLSGVDFWLTNPSSPASRGRVLVFGYRNGWLFGLKKTD